MAKDQTDKLEEKKKELEAELEQIQGELDDSIDKVRHDVSDKLDPKSFVRKHPLPVVGGAVLVGFLLGHDDKSGSSTSATSSSGKFSSTLLYELKRLAMRKALSFVTDFAEEKFDEKVGKHLPNSNGSAEE